MGLQVLPGAPRVVLPGEVAAEPAGGAAPLGLEVDGARLLAALLHEVAGQRQVAGRTGRSGELDQGELDLLVAVVAAQLARLAPEDAADVVGVPDDDVEQGRLPGGPVVGDSGFGEVTGAVQIVGVAQVGEAPLRGDVG